MLLNISINSQPSSNHLRLELLNNHTKHHNTHPPQLSPSPNFPKKKKYPRAPTNPTNSTNHCTISPNCRLHNHPNITFGLLIVQQLGDMCNTCRANEAPTKDDRKVKQSKQTKKHGDKQLNKRRWFIYENSWWIKPGVCIGLNLSRMEIQCGIKTSSLNGPSRFFVQSLINTQLKIFHLTRCNPPHLYNSYSSKVDGLLPKVPFWKTKNIYFCQRFHFERQKIIYTP